MEILVPMMGYAACLLLFHMESSLGQQDTHSGTNSDYHTENALAAGYCDERNVRCERMEYCCSVASQVRCCSQGPKESVPLFQTRFHLWNVWYFWFAVIFILGTCFTACNYWRRRQQQLLLLRQFANAEILAQWPHVGSSGSGINSRYFSLRFSDFPVFYGNRLGRYEDEDHTQAPIRRSDLPPPQFDDIQGLPPSYAEALSKPEVYHPPLYAECEQARAEVSVKTEEWRPDSLSGGGEGEGDDTATLPPSYSDCALAEGGPSSSPLCPMANSARGLSPGPERSVDVNSGRGECVISLVEIDSPSSPSSPSPPTSLVDQNYPSPRPPPASPVVIADTSPTADTSTAS